MQSRQVAEMMGGEIMEAWEDIQGQRKQEQEEQEYHRKREQEEQEREHEREKEREIIQDKEYQRKREQEERVLDGKHLDLQIAQAVASQNTASNAQVAKPPRIKDMVPMFKMGEDIGFFLVNFEGTCEGKVPRET